MDQNQISSPAIPGTGQRPAGPAHLPSAEGVSAGAEPTYDVVVIGGAFSGAGFALLLKRWLPQSRILVVERSERFERRVGEATVETSALFLHRILGLYDVLAREHLPKHGLRYWFSDQKDRSLSELSEVGPAQVPSLPSFQLDRSRMDQALLDQAVEEGVELQRPTRVLQVEPQWPQSRVVLEEMGEDGAKAEREISARWIIDASGRHAFLARRLRLHQREERHPTAAVWGRWDGVRDLDGAEVLGKDPRTPQFASTAASRRLATNHFCGYGWWCWLIPLAGGQTSIGLVYHKDMVQLPEGSSAIQRYQRFLAQQPGLRELIASARLLEEDAHSYSHLPYRTERYMEPGWALLGDAASFMDPYYSPGLDHAVFSLYATARIVEDDLSGRLQPEELTAKVQTHNRQFLRAYDRWLEGLYLGKYELLGDAELTTCAFCVDTALYYMGVVSRAVEDLENLRVPPFGDDHPQAANAHRFMRFFNRRMNRLARFRRQVGTYGRRNIGWYLPTRSPGLRRASLPLLRQGLGMWLRLESELLFYRLRHWRRLELSQPIATPQPAQR